MPRTDSTYGAPSPYFHWWYVWIPIFGAFLWFAMLWAMLITWLAEGRPHYVSMSPGQKIAYISDIGATFLQPLFIVGCVITAICFFAGLVIERWLRHSGRLLPTFRVRERVFSSLSMFWAFVGGVGLILLSCFNTKNFETLHRLFLLIFMVGVVLSAIFTIVEYRWLSKDFRDARKLRVSYRAKALMATILIILAVAFGICLKFADDAGAILEWLIAFGFTFYLLWFFYDLRLSKGIARNEFGRERLLAQNGFFRSRGRRGTVMQSADAPALTAPEMGNVGRGVGLTGVAAGGTGVGVMGATQYENTTAGPAPTTGSAGMSMPQPQSHPPGRSNSLAPMGPGLGPGMPMPNSTAQPTAAEPAMASNSGTGAPISMPQPQPTGRGLYAVHNPSSGPPMVDMYGNLITNANDGVGGEAEPARSSTV